MSKSQLQNWRKGMIVGFYAYMFLLLINIFSDLSVGSEPLSSIVIFWSGFGVALVVEFVLNRKEKKVDETHTS
ncbi:hypothetical protein [Pontibacillus yanchengensis]|nr:hypothetical protein [Pontibacillus yanchengensis]